MAGVRVENLCKNFDGSTNVVDNISFEINDQEFVVIVGPSGCGKTTTLNILAGLEQASSGSVYIGETCVNNVSPKDRNIAMVFQTHALYPHLSVKDNLAFSLKIQHLDKKVIEQRVNDVAALLEITDLLKRKPKQLSGGQKQRVAIGKALVRNPLVFLMDEPLSNLDANLKSLMREELKKLHHELKATFIYVTHDQVEAMTLASTLIVMNNGKIQQIGTPIDVFLHPHNLFVGRFIGSHPMNYLECATENTSSSSCEVDVLGKRIRIEFLSGKAPDKVTIGIRAEHIKVCDDPLKQKVIIDSFEVLGSDSILHCVSEDKLQKVSVLVTSSEKYHRGKTILIEPIASNILVFDAINGIRYENVICETI